jgi:hypothetical protein
MPTIEPIPWTELQVGKTYNVLTSCVDANPKPFVLKEIIVFPDIEGRSREAMLIATNGGGYAVGGNFDEPGGPMNLFFPFPSPKQAAMAAEPPDFPNAALASVLEHMVGILELPSEEQQKQEQEQEQEQQPPPPLPIDTSYTDFSMAYGLRRCRLCGYNEGPLPCPSDCYNMTVPTPSSDKETGQ